ncbi:MAG: hypothetical protein LBG64_03140 [Pseudomonadales bacterium]|jgi:hypothetical protein|nr:hypothetical protein [Pseudomonadales bacterium]
MNKFNGYGIGLVCEHEMNDKQILENIKNSGIEQVMLAERTEGFLSVIQYAKKTRIEIAVYSLGV